MNLENFFEEIMFPKFPLNDLLKLHGDLTNFENYLQISAGGYVAVKHEIEVIYMVQELIEDIVNENKKQLKEEKLTKEIENLDLDF